MSGATYHAPFTISIPAATYRYYALLPHAKAVTTAPAPYNFLAPHTAGRDLTSTMPRYAPLPLFSVLSHARRAQPARRRAACLRATTTTYLPFLTGNAFATRLPLLPSHATRALPGRFCASTFKL